MVLCVAMQLIQTKVLFVITMKIGFLLFLTYCSLKVTKEIKLGQDAHSLVFMTDMAGRIVRTIFVTIYTSLLFMNHAL